MAQKKAEKIKKQKPKRPIGKVLSSVKQVFKITHVPEEESIWSWGQAGAQVLPPKIEIAIWNVWKGSGGEEFYHEYQRILKDKNLVLMQEALLTLRALGQYVPEGYTAHHGATYRRKDGIRDGVMTISSAAPCSDAQRVLCLAPEPLLKTTKATLITSYKIADSEKVLCVINTHSTLMRRPSMAVKELEQVIDQIANHVGPMIYAGDFNTFSNAYIKQADKVLGTIGLRRVIISGDPRTATTALDQVYVRDLEVLKVVVDTSYTHSDHFPIQATLQIL